jgi:hypothetical protein
VKTSVGTLLSSVDEKTIEELNFTRSACSKKSFQQLRSLLKNWFSKDGQRAAQREYLTLTCGLFFQQLQRFEASRPSSITPDLLTLQLNTVSFRYAFDSMAFQKYMKVS